MMSLKKIYNNEKGITLAALIVMIVLLMILAGITINYVKNGNEILNKAKTSSSSYKDKTKTSSEELEKMEKHSDKLSENLSENTINKDSNNTTAIIGSKKVIEINDNTIKLTENGKQMEATIDIPSTAENLDESKFDENTKNILSKVYGTEVKYVSDSDSNTDINNKTWRIFYIDFANKYGDGEGTIYLKADWSSNDKNLKEIASNYEPTDTSKLEKMNKKWWANRENDTWNANEHEVAWLCDISKWTNYKATNANYAIGSPSIEMYCNSYNSVNHTANGDVTENYTLNYEYSTSNTPGYILKMNGKYPSVINSTGSESGFWTTENSIDYANYNSMYCGEKSGKSSQSTPYYWWIASPSSYSVDNMIHVDSVNAKLNTEKDDTAYSVCPVVSIKKGTELEIVSNE